MKVSYSWLKKIVAFDFSPQKLADILTELGLEVDSIMPFGQNLDGFVVAKVVDVKLIDESKHLTLCTVDTGTRKYSVVCGAPNVRKGIKSAFAVTGTKLPDGTVISTTKISGYESEGMLCSKKELGIGDDDSGIVVLDSTAGIGEPLASIDDLSDWILEIELTPNRPDCLNMRGVAREIAVALKTSIMDKQRCIIEDKLLNAESIGITIENSELCENYSAYIIRGIKVEPSPFWLAHRLEMLGIRSINNIVDITNYVMMELGHPLHAFDLDKLAGPEIVVRCAKEGEVIETLDGKTRTLDSSMLVIADKIQPVAVAGIMGGASSEVTENTKNILLEGAYFNPVSVRTTARKLGLTSESSYRFERGADRGGFQEALQRAAYMIAGIGNASSRSCLIEHNAKPYSPVKFECSIERIRSLIGVAISDEKIKEIIESLNITILSQTKNTLTVQPASYRVDLSIEQDIAEEIARIYGYNNIPVVLPGSDFVEYAVNKKHQFARFSRNLLVGAGFFETVTCSLHPASTSIQIPSFFSKDGGSTAIPIKNPLSEMHQRLQTTLAPNILAVIENNIRQKSESIKLFELGTIFLPDKITFSHEKSILALGVSGQRELEYWGHSGKNWDFFAFKGVLESFFASLGLNCITFQRTELPYLHSGKTAAIYIKNIPIGYLGQIHPLLSQQRMLKKDTFIAELDVDAILKEMAGDSKYAPLPKYPAIERDLAIVIDSSTPFQHIYNTIMNSMTGLLENFRVISIYEGDPIPPGKKSLSLRMRYRSLEKTLNDRQVDEIHDKMARIVVETLQCSLR
ncbi:phenylalanine--tRNA ligase subunit beta [bacterium]|nr:phenylalanine--tRNA ligase subunit beta [bacterium]MCP5462392.1 phenylalanine--tRNA ligase subunit beta [bacterium]